MCTHQFLLQHKETYVLSLIELQEDFPRTPSPVYQLSRSSSRAANEESGDATPKLDMQLTHLWDVLLTSVTPAELNAIVAAGLGSHSLTPIPGVASIHGQSSGLAAPVPRTASLDFPVSSITRSASPGLATIGSVSG
jgi:pumilio RNA-binding family